MSEVRTRHSHAGARWALGTAAVLMLYVLSPGLYLAAVVRWHLPAPGGLQPVVDAWVWPLDAALSLLPVQVQAGYESYLDWCAGWPMGA